MSSQIFREEINSESKICRKCFDIFWTDFSNSCCNKCNGKQRRESCVEIKSFNEEEKQLIQQILPSQQQICSNNSQQCFQCKKFTGIRGFKCQCNYNYCQKHRMPEQHSCLFDYEGENKRYLVQSLAWINISKIQRF